MKKERTIVVKEPCREPGCERHPSLGYCRNPRHHRYYRIQVSVAWARKYDNGCLVSIGLIVGEDDFTAEVFRRLPQANVEQIDYDTWNHAGCQSKCIMRGAPECRW